MQISSSSWAVGGKSTKPSDRSLVSSQMPSHRDIIKTGCLQKTQTHKDLAIPLLMSLIFHVAMMETAEGRERMLLASGADQDVFEGKKRSLLFSNFGSPVTEDIFKMLHLKFCLK